METTSNLFLYKSLVLMYSKSKKQYEEKKITKEKYITTWRNKWITSGAGSIDDFIKVYESLAEKFRQWKEWGITLEDDGGIGDDYSSFVTDDMDVAIKAGFTFYMGEDRETEYRETTDGREIAVPKEKL